jgi:hypothetical protein
LIPVALAALFGALRFANVHENMVDVSAFFQQLAITIGSCGLILGAYGLVATTPLQNWTWRIFIVAGVVLFLLIRLRGAATVQALLPLVAMMTVLAIGIWAGLTQRKATGGFLLTAVILSAASQWALGGITSKDLGIDVFHYLLAGSLVCFGLAAGSGHPNLSSTAQHN